MEKSANQKYKQSKTRMPFKQWLKEEQSKGQLDIHEDSSFNAIGSEPSERLKNNNNKLVKNVLLFGGLALAVYGVYKLTKDKGASVASMS